MKEQNVGLTSKDWILSILGIIILSCLIILPPLFRTFIKEEVTNDPVQQDEVIVTTTCKNENITAIDYNDNETIIFNHKNQKIQGFSKTTIRTYLDPMVYQEEKLRYGKLVTALSIIDGYEYGATLEDDNSSVNIQEKYDLVNFKPTTVLVPGDEHPTAITTSYQLNDDISKVKNYLSANGYTCIDNE